MTYYSKKLPLFLRNDRVLLRVHHVARWCGISPRTVRDLAAKGKIPAFKLGPKIWGFRSSAIIQWWEKGRAHGHR
jgi:excisionase family DNA binding protein